jgi:hypothetical protein
MSKDKLMDALSRWHSGVHFGETGAFCNEAAELARYREITESKTLDRPMKIYIAGKITGDPNYRAKFSTEEESLASRGYIVMNPATMPDGLTASDYMRMSFALIDAADVIEFLPDWMDSKGALIEQAYCAYVGKVMIFKETKRDYGNCPEDCAECPAGGEE